MAKSSKPKEIVVVGSKIKETNNPPSALGLNVGADVSGRLSWDVELTPVSSAPPPGYAHAFFDDFEPLSLLALPGTTLTEDPLGITIGVNDNIPEVGDEVLVVFIAGDVAGNHYQVELYLHDPSGTALDASGLMTPLDLQLSDFATATLSLAEPGLRAPFATSDVFSLESFVVPEPTAMVLMVSMLGTFVAGKLWRW